MTLIRFSGVRIVPDFSKPTHPVDFQVIHANSPDAFDGVEYEGVISPSLVADALTALGPARDAERHEKSQVLYGLEFGVVKALLKQIVQDTVNMPASLKDKICTLIDRNPHCAWLQNDGDDGKGVRTVFTVWDRQASQAPKPELHV